MPKHEFFSPKSIANRIKAKGLQKLRWYCQICNKQCRDENGFKCHSAGESHNRMMKVFGENPHKFITGYSQMFEKNFLQQLKISHPFARVQANGFYQDFIKHRHHIHMNSTKWLTLTDFIQHLGREGKCKVEETDKGWYITLKREEINMSSNNEVTPLTKNRVVAGKTLRSNFSKRQGNFDNGNIVNNHLKDTKHTSGGPLHFQLRYTSSMVQNIKTSRNIMFNNDERSLIQEPWVGNGIIVKVLNQEIADYYLRKGLIRKIKNRYIVELMMVDGGDILCFDQSELETVIPPLGSSVLILKGRYRGTDAILKEFDSERFQARLIVAGELYFWFEYEYFSKLVGIK